MQSIKKSKSGFTLIELLTTITVIGTILTISVGLIRSYQPTLELQSSARNLRTTLSLARTRAIAEQKNYGVRFNTINNTYEQILSDPQIQVLSTHEFSQNITYVSFGPFVNDLVVFNKAGASSESGAIILKNAQLDQKQVVINASGYTKVE
jgi:prepilin-type N-terminal cleavage/methylation domain-containing protein